MNISWTGPNVETNESNRITAIPAYYNGRIHTSTLQFSYISEDDINTSYNCTVFLTVGNETLQYHKSFTISELTSKLSWSLYNYNVFMYRSYVALDTLHVAMCIICTSYSLSISCKPKAITHGLNKVATKGPEGYKIMDSMHSVLHYNIPYIANHLS